MSEHDSLSDAKRSRQRSERCNAIYFLELFAKLPATRVWRLPPHLHAIFARVETPPRPPVIIQAAPYHLPSTKRCATHFMTPCACLRQEKRGHFFHYQYIARQIAAYRALHFAPGWQSSSFVALRQSQSGSSADLAGCRALCSRGPSPSPTRTHSSRSSPRAEPLVEVLLQTLAHFIDQLAVQSVAQSAAHLSALSAVMQRYDTLHPARPPSKTAFPTSRHASHRK